METTYRRFGRVFRLPSTTQLKDEFRRGFFPDFLPLTQPQGKQVPNDDSNSNEPPETPSGDLTANQPTDLSNWESEGGAQASISRGKQPAVTLVREVKQGTSGKRCGSLGLNHRRTMPM